MPSEEVRATATENKHTKFAKVRLRGFRVVRADTQAEKHAKKQTNRHTDYNPTDCNPNGAKLNIAETFANLQRRRRRLLFSELQPIPSRLRRVLWRHCYAVQA